MIDGPAGAVNATCRLAAAQPAPEAPGLAVSGAERIGTMRSVPKEGLGHGYGAGGAATVGRNPGSRLNRMRLESWKLRAPR